MNFQKCRFLFCHFLKLTFAQPRDPLQTQPLIKDRLLSRFEWPSPETRSAVTIFQCRSERKVKMKKIGKKSEK